VCAFIEKYARVPNGQGALRQFKVRDWQREMISPIFDEPRPRQSLISIPAGNGKSTLAAAIGLYGLMADGVEGAQVLVIAGDQRQAGIVWNQARRMVELNRSLKARIHVLKSALKAPQHDAIFAPLPSLADALEGWRPSLVILDELHVVSTDVYEAIAARLAKQEHGQLVAFSTPPRDGNTDGSVMWKLVEKGRDGSDPSFFFREYAAPAGCAVDDEEAWAIANPGMDDLVHRDALRSTCKTMRESTFRAYHLGMWPTLEASWLPAGAWDRCAAAQARTDGADVVLALDGSFSGDSTALIGCTIEPVPYIFVVGLWERPDGHQGDDWRVPVFDVEDAIREACRRLQVREIACDPFRWTRTMQVLEGEGLPVLEFPQSPARMAPATAGFYKAVVDRGLRQDGDPRLARHVASAVLKEDSRGARIVKESRHSQRKIDAAVCAVMAYSRAVALVEESSWLGVY